jgi:hypothetical protein
MEDKTYGWTVEMQLKVLKQNVLCRNSVRYIESEFQSVRNVKGSVMAGIKIIGWIFKYTLNKIPYKGQKITCYNFLISS